MRFGRNIAAVPAHMRLDNLLKSKMQKKQSVSDPPLRKELFRDIPFFGGTTLPVIDLFFHVNHGFVFPLPVRNYSILLPSLHYRFKINNSIDRFNDMLVSGIIID